MQRIVQQITQKLIDRLPENNQYYRLDELRTWDFPPFIVNRIKIELERNLAESMIIPKTDWANTKSNAVLNAWQQFVDAIRAEARLPASYGKAVIETAVADVLDILVQPRKNIPEVIFGANDELTVDEVRERVKSVVVYRHFRSLIPRFMEKKKLDTLSKKHCSNIIEQADQKFTADYSPLNWAQMLEPLFTLIGEEVDSNLLRLFFEDKDKPRLARQFDLINDTLTRGELIETISSPDSLNFEGDGEDQSSLFDSQSDSTDDDRKSENENFPEKKDSKDINSDEKSLEFGKSSSKEEENKTQQSASGEYEDTQEKESANNEPEETVNTGFAFEKGSKTESNPADYTEEEENSLNAIFFDQEPENAAQVDSSEFAGEGNEPEPIEIAPEHEKDTKSEEELTAEDVANEVDKPKKESVENDQTAGRKEPQEEDRESDFQKEEETPMWMRFMNDEEIEEYKKRLQEEENLEEQNAAEEDKFLDEPVIDLREEENSEEDMKKLKEELSDDRELFVEEIFRGSERAYNEAIQDIAGFNEWRDVSKYIEQDVFKRNLVDMYSEAAVDFTDRLQSYFLEK